MFNRLRFTPARRCAVEHSEQGKPFPGVAAEAASNAGGADGGQNAQTSAKAKSRRWRDGGTAGQEVRR